MRVSDDIVGQRRQRGIVVVVVVLAHDEVVVLQLGQLAVAQGVVEGQGQRRRELLDEVQVQVVPEVRVVAFAVREPRQGRAIAQAQIGPRQVQVQQQFDLVEDAEAVGFVVLDRRAVRQRGLAGW
jgi:hypothetical protein